MHSYKLFRRDKVRWRIDGVALYIREWFDYLEVSNGNSNVECLWVRKRGKANEADIAVGILDTTQPG